MRKSVIQILDFFHREGKKEKEVEEKVVKKEERTEIGKGSKEGKAREREKEGSKGMEEIRKDTKEKK